VLPDDLAGAGAWAVTAFFDAMFGLALGLLLIPVAVRAIMPAFAALTAGR